MTLCLGLIIMFMLLSEGICIKTEYLFKRVGEDALLHCDVYKTLTSSNQCADILWLYRTHEHSIVETLSNENNVAQDLARASRLSVSSDCSLTIRNISDEDAGQYVCRLGSRSDLDTVVDLKTLRISSSDVNGRVDLTCSMKSFNDYCEQNSIIWIDETGSKLSGENSEFQVKKQTNCVSVLTVKHQRENRKRFTCQFGKDNKVIIEAVYDLTGKYEQTEHLYQRVGEDVFLPCRDKSSSSSCSDVDWLYQKDPNADFRRDVHNGKVDQSLSGASRLSVSSNCSLLIRNITDEDAGLYVCQLKNKNDAQLVLDTFSISSEPPHVHPGGNGSFTLKCSLNRYNKHISCKENSLIWVDETGSQLSGDGVWFDFKGQTNCVSFLTVKHQSGNNNKVTCQFSEGDKIKIDAFHSLNFPGSTQSDISTFIIIGAVVCVVFVLLVVSAVLLFRAKRAKATKEHSGEKNFPILTHLSSEPESGPESELMYAAVNHSKSKATSKITIKEEEGEVTYSTVKRN